MINLRYSHKLLFCSLDLTIDNKLLHLENVLLDTGSATTLINSDYIHFDGNEELNADISIKNMCLELSF